MELNEKQYEAVRSTEGPLLLISGPGSGKTRTLVERAIYLLVEKKVKPENIFLSTFIFIAQFCFYLFNRWYCSIHLFRIEFR